MILVNRRPTLMTVLPRDDPDCVAAFEAGGAATAGDRHCSYTLCVVHAGNREGVEEGVLAHLFLSLRSWAIEGG